MKGGEREGVFFADEKTGTTKTKEFLKGKPAQPHQYPPGTEAI